MKNKNNKLNKRTEHLKNKKKIKRKLKLITNDDGNVYKLDCIACGYFSSVTIESICMVNLRWPVPHDDVNVN